MEIDWEWVEGTPSSDVVVGHSWQRAFLKYNTSIFQKDVFWVFLMYNFPILVKPSRKVRMKCCGRLVLLTTHHPQGKTVSAAAVA